VLKAVNLGGDTDTTGCVTGGLAGILFGIGAIPPPWRSVLARSEEIGILFGSLAEKVAKGGFG
jgi:ADP-ribosylglycohydrolase